MQIKLDQLEIGHTFGHICHILKPLNVIVFVEGDEIFVFINDITNKPYCTKHIV